jgi:hypothetical protein
MLKAAQIAQAKSFYSQEPQSVGMVEIGLEAALRWLAENPIVPTAEDWADCHQSLRPGGRRGDGGWQWLVRNAGDGPALAAEWQRRMFLATKLVPEAPEEIKDLLVPQEARDVRGTETNCRILEAFLRGQTTGIIEAVRLGREAGKK